MVLFAFLLRFQTRQQRFAIQGEQSFQSAFQFRKNKMIVKDQLFNKQ